MDKSNKEIQHLRVNGLISHLHTLKTLLRQGVAIRGSDETDANIIQFNLDKASADSDLKEFMRLRQYFGHAVIAEQEQMLVLNARRRVLGNIKDRQYFSIVANEATNISKVEQMSITIRTCTKDYQIQEHFIDIRE